jgi:ubiquinone/menaquinone biosynthesis C-methylase UbiE
MGSGKVLELGPGTGRNMQFLPKGVDWSGVDINPALKSTLLENAARQGFPPATIQLTTENLKDHLKSCSDSSLDAILCVKVLCCLKDDVDLVLSDINRVLKPGGRLYFVESTPPWGPYWGFQQLLAPFRYLLTGTRSNTNVAPAIHQAFQEVYMENWPGFVDPADVRLGIRKVSYSKETGVSGMKGTVINQCVVAGICTKEKKKSSPALFRSRLP